MTAALAFTPTSEIWTGRTRLAARWSRGSRDGNLVCYWIVVPA